MSSERNYALVLGASSGFGKACTLALAAEGYHIFGVHLDRAAGLAQVEEMKAEIRSFGVEAHFFNVNAADADRRKEIIAAIKAECSQHENASIKVLLHSLAFGSLLPIIAHKPASMLSQKQIEMTMDVMANSLVYWTQDVVSENLFGRGGRVFGLTSAGSHRVLPMYGAVSAAKAAMESYIRQMAFELAPWEITGNAIRAGVTDTPALRKIPGNDVLIENAMSRNPFHRLTTPEDIANALKLLIKPEAGWINGTVIGIDGGEDAVDVSW
ncbi:MAG: SDR family oxidoreductase [Ignavibacteria bacterium]|nr:SDR family oxidoreductase [Ignavibacteria bacterium]